MKIRITLAISAAVVLVAACGSSDAKTADDPATSSPSSSSTTDAAFDGPKIPDGTYSKTVTTADVERLGITDQGVVDGLGPNGRTEITFKFDGEQWTQFADDADGVPVRGDLGTLTYDAKGQLVETSHNTESDGNTYVYEWKLSGDDLSLDLVDHQSPETPEELEVVRFVSAGTFTRQK